MKKVLWTIAFVILFYIGSTKLSYAQGTYSCAWTIPPGSITGQPSCIVHPLSNCDTENSYFPGNACESVNENGEGFEECVSLANIECVKDEVSQERKHMCIAGQCRTCADPDHQDCYFDNAESCSLYCRPGSAGGLTWSCSSSAGCLLVPIGETPPGNTYSDELQCLQTCGAVNNFKLYCDWNDKPTSDGSLTERIYTAFGCISITNITNIVTFILKWAIGFSSGVAFILIIIASIMIIFSSGNPEKLQSGKELLIAALSGMLLIIFAVFLLRFVGVNILNIFL